MSRTVRSAAIAIAIAVLLAAAGCFDVSVPDGALISCGDDDVCPAPLVCEPTSRLCVRSVAGDELTAPTAQIEPALVGGPFLDRGGEVVVDVAFEVAPLRAPTLELVQDGTALASFDVAETGEHEWRGTLTTSRALPEGRLAVVVEAVDARGLPKRFPAGFLDVDVTPPVIGNVSLQRLPDPRKTPVAFDIVDDTAVGPNVDVRLAFSLDEAASTTDAPTARLDGSSLPFERDETVENPVTFTLAWPDAATLDSSFDGAYDVVVRVVDLADNAIEQVVVSGLEIDVTPPPLPSVDVPGEIVFERAPWGRSGTAGLDVYTVRGAPSAVAAGDFVIVTRDAEGQREIGRTRADDTGFGGVDRGFFLATGDVRDVFLVLADAAGNVSTPTAVRETRWIASPGGKLVGDDIDNPHHLEELPILLPQLSQSGVIERGADDGAGAVDAEDLVTTGAGTFTARASDDGDALIPTGGLLVGSAVGHDPVRGLTVVYGGSLSANIPEGPFAGSNTGCRSAVGDVFVRGADGRFRRLVLPSTATRPPPMSTGRFVFDTRRNLLVLIGRPDFGVTTAAPQMWSFDGQRFAQLCTDDACAASVPANLAGVGLAADPVRQVLVAHGGGLGAETFEFDGSVWRAVCDGACVEASGGAGGLVWDDVAGRVLWFDGASLAAWDGTNWTALCTDDACLASAPPLRNNTTAAWDRRRGKLVTFGGDNPTGDYACDHESQNFPRNGVPDDVRAEPPFADTWEFDGTSWTQRVTPSAPPSRSLHQMAWDERTGGVLVVGGDDCACTQHVRDPGFRPEIEQNAWEFDGDDWRRVDVAPAPPPGFVRRAPLPLAFHTLVPSTGTATGGHSGGVLAYGDQTDRLVLIEDGRFYDADVNAAASTFLAPIADDPSGELFALDGGPYALRFVTRTTQAVCAPDPTCGSPGATPPLFGYAMAHDGDRLVIFGGARGINGTFGATFSDTAIDETFTFDATSGLQHQCSGGSCGAVPARRVRARLAPTGNAGEVLLFGGSPGDGGTWTFAGGAWTQQTTTTQPPQRQDLILTFDPSRDAVMMTGGTDDNPSNDTRGALLERALPAFLDVVYEWTGDWHEARVVDPEGDGRPSPRFAAGAAADPSGGVTIQGGVPSPKRLFGGPPGSDRLVDVWSWDGGAERAPAQRFRVTTTAAGLRATDVIAGATVRWFGENDDGTPPTLAVWNGAAYVDLDAVACGAGCVEAALDDALTRRSLTGPARELVVVARGRQNGAAPHYSTVRTDFVEVTLATRAE